MLCELSEFLLPASMLLACPHAIIIIIIIIVVLYVFLTFKDTVRLIIPVLTKCYQ